MASITTDRDGNRRIMFVDVHRKRKAIYLGKAPLKTAETIRRHVEILNDALGHGHVPDIDTTRWVQKLSDKLHKRLSAVGLVTKRESALLGPFIDGYIKGRTDTKPATATVYGHTRRCLVEYFGAGKPLREITPGHADAWRLWLMSHEVTGEDGKKRVEKLADNTVRRRCGIAKQFFRAALRRGLVNENPFVDFKGLTITAVASRSYFLSREDAQKVLDACPDAQWRVLFALSRFGGLRCPSEHLALTWGDIDWERGRMRVTSPKTEHHEGGEFRWVPLFPELRKELDALWELVPEKTEATEPVITRYRDSNANLRTQLERIIGRAGLTPWPKLFQNLRATRETELCESFPIHVVCAWIGNSAAVAAKHYLQVTDDHFKSATELPTQNPTQQAAASVGTAGGNQVAIPVFPQQFSQVPIGAFQQVGDEGLEPPTSTV